MVALAGERKERLVSMVFEGSDAVHNGGRQGGPSRLVACVFFLMIKGDTV